jgi:hypothetical protein
MAKDIVRSKSHKELISGKKGKPTMGRCYWMLGYMQKCT